MGEYTKGFVPSFQHFTSPTCIWRRWINIWHASLARCSHAHSCSCCKAIWPRPLYTTHHAPNWRNALRRGFPVKLKHPTCASWFHRSRPAHWWGNSHADGLITCHLNHSPACRVFATASALCDEARKGFDRPRAQSPSGTGLGRVSESACDDHVPSPDRTPRFRTDFSV